MCATAPTVFGSDFRANGEDVVPQTAWVNNGMASTFYELSAHDIDGKEIDFASLKGKVCQLEALSEGIGARALGRFRLCFVIL